MLLLFSYYLVCDVCRTFYDTDCPDHQEYGKYQDNKVSHHYLPGY